MSHRSRWRPNKKDAVLFANKMQEIEAFCIEHNIQSSRGSNSYYFTVNNQMYRVSNHTIEASNRNAYDEFGNLQRDKYHPDYRSSNVRYIHASKTRIIEIYNNIVSGKKLDGRGNVVDVD